MEFITGFVVFIILLFAIILHEIAHGWTAYVLGDPTAKLAGRLTLNPLKHIDPVGTILIPGFLLLLRSLGMSPIVFGWAKPVPVNFSQLRSPKRDIIWVGLAGPFVNILLALGFRQLLNFSLSPFFREVVGIAIFVNLLLAVFNMIPIPPLDGSRLVMGILPMRWASSYARLERYGILIVAGLLYSGLLDKVIWPVLGWLSRLLGVQFQ